MLLPARETKMKCSSLVVTLAALTSLYAGPSFATVQEENKKTVAAFFEGFSRRDPKAFQLVSPTVKWWVPESLPFGRVFETAASYFAMLRTTFAGFPSGLALVVKEMVAEGNVVTAEV